MTSVQSAIASVERLARHARDRARRAAPERARGRVGVRVLARRDELETLESHRLHRARGAADVPGMRRAHEHDARALRQSCNRVACPSWRAILPAPESPGRALAMHALVNIAVRAARRAGDHDHAPPATAARATMTAKSRNDFVTEVDRLAEREIIDTIRRRYPDHAILGEESGAFGDGRRIPVDHRSARRHDELPARLPACSACRSRSQRRRSLEHAVVYDPSRAGAVHGIARATAPVERRTHPREQRIAARRRADRHRLSVSRQLGVHRPLYGDAQGRDARGAPACAARARPRSIWLTSPQVGSTASGKSASRLGHGGRLAADTRSRRAHRATCAATTASWNRGNVAAGTPKVFAEMLHAFAPHLSGDLDR